MIPPGVFAKRSGSVELAIAVGTVTERLFLRVAAPAQGHRLIGRDRIRIALGVEYPNWPFDYIRPVGPDTHHHIRHQQHSRD